MFDSARLIIPLSLSHQSSSHHHHGLQIHHSGTRRCERCQRYVLYNKQNNVKLHHCRERNLSESKYLTQTLDTLDCVGGGALKCADC